MNFRKVIETYGYPVVSKEVSHAAKDARSCPTGKVMARFKGAETTSMIGWAKYAYLLDAPFKIDHRCCDVMKKRPAHKFEKETGLKPVIATMASESILRKKNWERDGCNAFDGKRPASRPISFWNEQDVLRYLRDHKIPDLWIFETGIKITKNEWCFIPLVFHHAFGCQITHECTIFATREGNIALPFPCDIPLCQFLIRFKFLFFQAHPLQLYGDVLFERMVVIKRPVKWDKRAPLSKIKKQAGYTGLLLSVQHACSAEDADGDTPQQKPPEALV